MLEEIVQGGVVVGENGDGGVRLLCYFRHRWLDFRLPEIESLVSDRNQLSWSLPRGENPLSPFWYVHLPDLDEARSIAQRSVLLKAFIEVWGEGSDFEELQKSIESCPEETKAPFYPESVSFRVIVDGWGCKVTQEEKVQSIERLNDLPLKGPIDLKRPDEVYWLIIADPSRVTGFPGVPYRLYFGRQIAVPDHSVIQSYGLSQRDYLGPTSMDAEMAIVMCNHARVKRGSLVMDPFVGTGSILVAAAHLGCVTLGCDIDVKILKQSKRNKRGEMCDIWSNFSSYGIQPPIGLLVCDIHHAPFRSKPLEMFDALICDPPYGVRAGSKKHCSKHQERKGTMHYSVMEMCIDLMDFAARMLRTGGRLVFFCPSTPASLALSDLPTHPMLNPVFRCEQYLTMRYSRCLITMEKIRDYNKDEVQTFLQQANLVAASLDDVHDVVFEKRSVHTPTAAIPKFRCKQL